RPAPCRPRAGRSGAGPGCPDARWSCWGGARGGGRPERSNRRRWWGSSAASPLLAGVELEGARRRELTELVADHRLGDIHRHVLATVVHGDGVAHHVGEDRAAARPGLDDPLLALLVQLVDLLQQVVVDEGTLLQAARHDRLPPGAAGAPAADDELLGRLVGVAGAALGLAPRRDRVTTTRGLALATAVRVVDGVHGDTTGLGADALPAVAARLAHLDEFVLGVADLPDGGTAVDGHAAHLGARQAQGGEVALLGHELDARAGAAGHAAALAGLELDVVDGGADGDVAHRHGVARTDLRALAVLERVADLHAIRGEDVALLAVEVVQQGDATGAVRVVLDGGDLGGHAVLVPLEVDDAVLLLVATAAVTGGLAPVAVAATGARLGGDERLLRLGRGDLGEVRDRLEPAAGAGRLLLAKCHDDASFYYIRSMESRSAVDTIAR